MKYTLNDTSSYHTHNIQTLAWELTICNSLESRESPLRSLLRYQDTYGSQLYRYMKKILDFKEIENIMEIGGGYGFLMRDLLKLNRRLKPVMVDISEQFILKQKELLRQHDINFICDDFFNLPEMFFKNIHFAILNENTGDFPTIVNGDSNILWSGSDELDAVELQIRKFFDSYSLEKPEKNRPFNFNIGAMTALEKLCMSEVPYIFISEHSCEAAAPEEFRDALGIVPAEFPEKINLMGHDEYTIKFSFLEKIGKKFQYQMVRGPLIEIIEIDDLEKLAPIIFSTVRNDRIEILKQFIYDLFKYEFILFYK